MQSAMALEHADLPGGDEGMTCKDRVAIATGASGAGMGRSIALTLGRERANAVSYRLGLCDSQIAVATPGCTIEVSILEDWSICMTGSVTKVCKGVIADEMFRAH